MRTVAEIQAEMDAIQAKHPELDALNSTSQVSTFGLLKAMWVMLTQALEERFDALVADLKTQQASAQVGSIAWYVMMVKAFQLGDQVAVYDTVNVGYPTTDPSKQIIQQAAVSESTDGRLLIKVAKGVGGTFLRALSADELTSVRDYVRQIKYAGVAADVISLEADDLKLNVTIQYDRQVLSASGQRLTDPSGIHPAEAAVTDYISKLPFDSVLYWSALTQAVLEVPGVIDFQIRNAYIKPSGETAFTEFVRSTTSRAGYMRLSVESVFTYV